MLLYRLEYEFNEGILTLKLFSYFSSNGPFYQSELCDGGFFVGGDSCEIHSTINGTASATLALQPVMYCSNDFQPRTFLPLNALQSVAFPYSFLVYYLLTKVTLTPSQSAELSVTGSLILSMCPPLTDTRVVAVTCYSNTSGCR